MKTARQAQDNRATAQIAQSVIETAKQGALTCGTNFMDAQGTSCPAGSAIYTVVTTSQVLGNAGTSPIGMPTRLTVRITPVDAPDRARTYAVVYSAPQ